MVLLPDKQICRLCMRRECRERFSCHLLQRKPLVNDPGMHHGTCVTHVPWCMSGSLIRGGRGKDPSIPGACKIRNFEYLVRGPWNCTSFMCCWVLLWFGNGQFYPFPTGLLHGHWGNHMIVTDKIVPVTVKWPSKIWINEPHWYARNRQITATKKHNQIMLISYCLFKE